MTKKLKKKAFTLTELIVVIAIIGILAAVLIPSLTGYISKSKKSAAEQEAASVYQIYQAWQAESKTTSKYYPALVGKYYTVTNDTGPIVITTSGNQITALGLFAVYYAEVSGVALTGILTTDNLKATTAIKVKNISISEVKIVEGAYTGFTIVASNGYKVVVSCSGNNVEYEATK